MRESSVLFSFQNSRFPLGLFRHGIVVAVLLLPEPGGRHINSFDCGYGVAAAAFGQKYGYGAGVPAVGQNCGYGAGAAAVGQRCDPPFNTWTWQIERHILKSNDIYRVCSLL